MQLNIDNKTDNIISYQTIYLNQLKYFDHKCYFPSLIYILSDVPTLTSVTFNILEPQTECKQEMENNIYDQNILIYLGK